MKKGIVVLLVVLALVVLVSPGILGRIAERQVDESIDFAARESADLAVTSERFQRGWFFSEGRHRIAVTDGELADMLKDLFGGGDDAVLPVLVIDTRLDHGLIPVSSMAREGGTLLPGLGSAVSTMTIEFADGTSAPLPGTIYSRVALHGALTSRLVVDAGEQGFERGTASWGAGEVEVTARPASGAVSYEGKLASLVVDAGPETVRAEGLEFSGDVVPGSFGYYLGDLAFSLDSLRTNAAGEGAPLVDIGPMRFDGTTVADGDRVDNRASFAAGFPNMAGPGRIGVDMDIAIEDVDGLALGRLLDALDSLAETPAAPGELLALVEEELEAVVAEGLEFRFDKLDVELPEGLVESDLRLTVPPIGRGNFRWTQVLLALDGAAHLSVPEPVVEQAVAVNPQASLAVGMGFLKKSGDVYLLEAEYRKGLLTVNGAPMAVPLPGAVR